MQIELTVQVNLPDVTGSHIDGKVFTLDYSEQDIIDAVADLDYSFMLNGEELDTEITDISSNEQTLWHS